MNRTFKLLLMLVVGALLGVGLSSWRALPTEDMVARASCAACHDVHGAIEWADAPTQSQVWLLGDLPEASYFIVSDLFPYAQQEQGTSISLPDLLARYGVSEYERVAIESLDGGIVILERQYVTQESLLVPYLEGLRFKDANQHESTWLKGVRWIIVQGTDRPLRIAGEATSMGRLLLADRTTVIAEGGDAIFKSPLDGRTYRGDYAHTYTGARLSELLGGRTFTSLRVADSAGAVSTFTPEEVEGALVATVGGRPTLLLRGTGRGGWVSDLVEIEPQP